MELATAKLTLFRFFGHICFVSTQRLTGATLLVFANKQDLPGALKADEIKKVSISIVQFSRTLRNCASSAFCE